MPVSSSRRSFFRALFAAVVGTTAGSGRIASALTFPDKPCLPNGLALFCNGHANKLGHSSDLTLENLKAALALFESQRGLKPIDPNYWYLEPRQGLTTRYTHQQYSMGFKLSREEFAKVYTFWPPPTARN